MVGVLDFFQRYLESVCNRLCQTLEETKVVSQRWWGRHDRFTQGGKGYGLWGHFFLGTASMFLHDVFWRCRSCGCCGQGDVPQGFSGEARSLRGILVICHSRVLLWPLGWWWRHRNQWWFPWMAIPRWRRWSHLRVYSGALLMLGTIQSLRGVL